MLVKELSQMLERQFSGNAEFQSAGMVINTMGWIEGVGYEVHKFKTSMVIFGLLWKVSTAVFGTRFLNDLLCFAFCSCCFMQSTHSM